jgi:hypothetical protein
MNGRPVVEREREEKKIPRFSEPRKEYVVHYACPCGNAWGSAREEQRNRYMKCKHCGRTRLPENCDIVKMSTSEVQQANKAKQYMVAGWNAVSQANETLARDQAPST